jgi:hypothetical protein
MRIRALALSVLFLALPGCYGCPGDPDTGWCCNRPRALPCSGCVPLVPDPISFGRDCHQPMCCPDLPGRPIVTVRHHHHALPPAGAVIAAPAPDLVPVIYAPAPR